MQTLRLGAADRGMFPPDERRYYKTLHDGLAFTRHAFRLEHDGGWKKSIEVPGETVSRLQQDLSDFGFFGKRTPDGVFDYDTLSAVRLFQEYARTVGGSTTVGTPDGIVGRKGRAEIARWNAEATQADGALGPSPSRALYNRWFRFLNRLKAETESRDGPIQKRLRELNATIRSASLPAAEWKFDKTDLHLIGIRRAPLDAERRKRNNDVFVLLAKGMVFVFFGSTDPQKAMNPKGHPFLVPGQHLYRFGWHKLSSKKRVYRAFRPRNEGVLVIRKPTDMKIDRTTLSESAIAKAIQNSGAPDINIHWSGRGRANWSAGCQVIAGATYINHHDVLVDCWDHAATNYTGLAEGTKGAYNVLLDLMTVFSSDSTPGGNSVLRYTVVDEKNLELDDVIGGRNREGNFATDQLHRALKSVKNRDPRNYHSFKQSLPPRPV